MATDPSQIFQILRPICAKLSQEPTRSNVQSLQKIIKELEPDPLGRLTEYVMFPLHLILKRHGISSELKEDAVNCMEVFLQRVKVNKFSVFEDVFTQLSVLLSSQQPGQVASISEELKLSIVNCLSSLVDNTALVIRGVIYGTRFLPALGHAISLLLAVAEHEKARNLKISALVCLRKLAFCFDKPSAFLNHDNATAVNHSFNENADSANLANHLQESEMNDLASSIRSEAVIAFASFLPGITMTLCRIVSRDPQQGHVVMTTVIDTFGDIVSMVVGDSNLDDNEHIENDLSSAIAAVCLKQQTTTNKLSYDNEEQETSNLGIANEHYKAKQLRIHQTKEWFTSTGSKLKILIEKLCASTLGHSNWKVRLSLANLCNKLLTSCSQSLQDSIPGLLDVLVGLSEDEFPQVSTQSKLCLEQFSSQKMSSGPTSLSSMLEENLHSLLTILPRLMRTADDSKKLITLNLVNGYLRLLGDSLNTLLTSSSHLKRLSHAFIQVLELDVTDAGIIEERAPETHESAVLLSDTQGQNPLSFPAENVLTSQFPRYRFKNFTDDRIREALASSCQLLGCYGNLSLLVDHFLDLCNESRVQKKQAVFVLNEIILGSSGLGRRRNKEPKSGEAIDKSTDSSSNAVHELQTAIDLLMPAYVSEKNWNLPTSNPLNVKSLSDRTKQDLVLQTDKNTRVRAAGISFEALNSNIQLICLLLEGIGTFARVLGKDFEGYLIETLYLILAKLGDANAAVSRSAYGTCALICQSLGYSSVDQLISRNADYLVNLISSDFKYVFVNRRAPRVLQVMIQYSNQDILAIIEDTLGDVFAVMDLYPDELIYALMKVLYALVSAVGKWFAAADGGDDTSSDNKTPDKARENQKSTNTSVTEYPAAHPGTKPAFPQEMFEFVAAYHKSKLISLGEVEEEECDDMVSEAGNVDDEEDLYAPDQKAEVPRHVKYVAQVLEKCIHFLACRSPVVRLLVLDTVGQAVRSIRAHENDLLPMIHRVWPPLAKRLHDAEQLVITKAIHVVCTMAECSGDFMRRRVIKDVLPVLLAYLDKQSAVSIKAGPGYLHSQAYKLQLAALQVLGRLCRQLDINEAELDHVCCACALYLSSRQPPALQQASVVAFEAFMALEPDAVWLTLNQLYCPLVPGPPHAMFKRLSLGTATPECKEFADNVTYILGKLG